MTAATTLAVKSTHQLMTASTVHVTNPVTPPGSEWRPSSSASDGVTFTPSGSKTFTTASYPNQCPGAAAAAAGKRRRGLLAAASGAGAVAIAVGNPVADQKVADGYPAVDAALDAATGGGLYKLSSVETHSLKAPGIKPLSQTAKQKELISH
jgi:hypothetical protein